MINNTHRPGRTALFPTAQNKYQPKPAGKTSATTILQVSVASIGLTFAIGCRPASDADFRTLRRVNRVALISVSAESKELSNLRPMVKLYADSLDLRLQELDVCESTPFRSTSRIKVPITSSPAEVSALCEELSVDAVLRASVDYRIVFRGKVGPSEGIFLIARPSAKLYVTGVSKPAWSYDPMFFVRITPEILLFGRSPADPPRELRFGDLDAVSGYKLEDGQYTAAAYERLNETAIARGALSSDLATDVSSELSRVLLISRGDKSRGVFELLVGGRWGTAFEWDLMILNAPLFAAFYCLLCWSFRRIVEEHDELGESTAALLVIIWIGVLSVGAALCEYHLLKALF